MKKIFVFMACLGSLSVSAQNGNKDLAESIRKNALTFHKNFSTGDFDKNGPLVDEKIYVNSNNVIVIGRDKFVERIKRYHTPFPTLRLVDKIILVDGNEAGLLYVLQGTQDGPYGNIPASGNKVNAYSADFFSMNDKSEMKELLTITQLDRLVKQIKGEELVEDYEKITLMPTKVTNPAYKKLLKNKIDNYIQNINARDWIAFEKLFASNSQIMINGKKVASVKELIDNIEGNINIAPDMTYHLIRNVVEGDRGALAYEINGNYNKEANGKMIKTPILDVKQGAHFQFNSKGEIVSLMLVFNSDDIDKQLK